MAQHTPSIPGVPTSAASRCNRYEPIARRMSLQSRDNFFFAAFPIQGFPGNLEPIPIDRCTCEWLRSHAAKLLRIHCVRTCTNDVVAPKRSQSNRVRSIIAHASGFATIAAKLLHIRRVYSVKRGCWNIALAILHRLRSIRAHVSGFAAVAAKLLHICRVLDTNSRCCCSETQPIAHVSRARL